MKKHFTIITVTVLSYFISTGCACNRTSTSNLMVDNQQIVTPLHPETLRPDCDTLVITCIDYRFAVANQNFINETLHLKDTYDHISIPGSIFNLVNPETRDLVFSKFALTVKFHLVNRVVIISHKDCGAYGGSSTFGSELAEKEILCDDLKNAKALFLEKYPALDVDLYLESLSQEGDEIKVHFEKIH
ncbi:MAG: hypothetical protein FJ266_02880 [Planctomycetes bacterium]|nr:hypothetical protein [Planctomycetota bacterium]